MLAKAWYLYGPTVGEMQTIGARVAEVAEEAWTEYWQIAGQQFVAGERSASADGRRPPAPFVPPGAPMQPIPVAPGPATNRSTTGPVQLAGGVPAEIVPVAPLSPSSPWPPSPAEQHGCRARTGARRAPTQDPRLSAMLERLTQLGVRDQELAPWGSGGELVRFSCSVPWANSPGYSRHFEAVAATPVAAVEQVAAEIDAWRGQRSSSDARLIATVTQRARDA